jgi:hypothetical protein
VRRIDSGVSLAHTGEGAHQDPLNTERDERALGGRDESRGLALQAPILLDPSFGVAPTFGVNGTPMAVLIDADVRIASASAAGAQAVCDLANGHRQPRSTAG